MTSKCFVATIALCLWQILAFAGVTVTTYNLENMRAKAFLNDFTYKAGDGSRVGNYNIAPPERRDQPAPVTLEWEPTQGAASQQLYLSTSAVLNNAEVFTLDGSATSYDIYNLIPGKTYHYKIVALDEQGNELASNSASFATEGNLRMIKVESGYNFRDLGGWNTRSGKRIRYGMIYRSAEMNGKYELTSEDSAIVRNIGVLAELDLRSSSEAHNITVSRLGADVTYTRLSTGTYYIEGLKTNTSRFREQMQFVFDMVKQERPVVFHCHIGADRTGCLGFLIEGLLGVSESDIYKDYELTTFSALGTPRGKGQIEDMMAYIKTFDGATLEEQFYSYCTKALGLSTKDILEFKSAMLQYPFINTIDFGADTITVNAGEQIELQASYLPENASRLNISHTSSDPLVATITTRGLLTGIRGGTTVITAKANVLTKDVVVRVPYVESQVPQWITYGDMDYEVVGPNLISNGSFEYAHPFAGWTSGIEAELSDKNFALKDGTPWGDKYLQSLYGAGTESARSLRALWEIEPNKTYIFAYKVRSSNGQSVTANPNLKTSLTNLSDPSFGGSGDDFIWDNAAPSPAYSASGNGHGIIASEGNDEEIFAYPSYSGQWTDINYIFTNSKGYQYCQIVFSQLSDGNSHTCFDNFYLAELGEGEPTALKPALAAGDMAAKEHLNAYSLDGVRLNGKPRQGIYIVNGKKYIGQ